MVQKILLVGANGFIGRQVRKILISDKYKVTCTSFEHDTETLQMDATDYRAVLKIMADTSPSIVLNCAGIVTNDEKAETNVVITDNIMKAAGACESVERVIICGSAAEYGEVSALPVSENAAINPVSKYGSYKAKETELALISGKKYGIETIVARIFNPIGPGMHNRLLIPSVIQQFKEYKEGKREFIEVNRLDSMRDFLDVRDIATAFKLFIDCEKPQHSIYNIGSGLETSVNNLLIIIADEMKIAKPKLLQSSHYEEQKIASQADITRMRNEFGWSPKYNLQETLKELINE